MSDQERLAKLERLLRKAGIDVDAEEHNPAGAGLRPAKETPEAGAARLGISEGDMRALCGSLGANPSEITRVAQTEDGPVVDVGGTLMILRADPDAGGHVGWLRMRHPDPAVEESRRINCTGVPAFVPAAPTGGQAA
jgi:hypothetical protein